MPSPFEFLDLRVMTHYQNLVSILEGRRPSPRMAIIYPQYGCNLRCLGCEYDRENTANRSLERSRFLGLIEELSKLGVMGIEFCGGGEPTLYPYFEEIIEHALSQGLKLGLLTNGAFANEHVIELCARHFSYVRIAIDAGCDDVYRKTKQPLQPTQFLQVIDHAKRLVTLRKAVKSPCKISFKFLVNKINRHDIGNAVMLARSLGFDSIQFKALRLSEFELSPPEEIEVDQEIVGLRALNPEIPVVGSVHKVHIDRQCWLTPLQTVIDPLGDVYLCCYYLHRKESHSIGNIYSQDFHSIWHAPRHFEAIRTINPSECNLLDCRFVRYNDIADRLVKHDEGQFQFI